ncbi:hypothetical protein C6501_15380 [Candidatus Poribacteria bacterium]|nr:MAG: hypothetical protein C6501_15380 [Candidatus Poribacteria bacterium]
MSGESGAGNAWAVEVQELNNKWNDVDRSVNEYHEMRGHVETLISDWESTKKSVAEGTTVTILTGGAAIISAGVAYISGGSFAPAAWLFYIAARKGLATYSLDSDKYFEVMGAALGAMDTGRSNVDAAYNGGTMYVRVGGIETKQKTIGYAKQYKKYLQMCENHGIEHYVEGTDWTWTAASKEAIDALVNMQNQTRSWYHATETPSSNEHSITRRTDLSHWKVKPDLPGKYECEGSCTVKYRTPQEAYSTHLSICGQPDPSNFPRALRALHARAAGIGCGDTWYSCDSDFQAKNERHQLRTCTKDFINGNPAVTCGDSFRRCMGQGKDHNTTDYIFWVSKHDDKNQDDADDDDDSTAQNTQTPDSPTPTPTTPSYHACGVHETSVSGDHSLVAANSWSGYCTTHSFYACQANDHISVSCSETNGWGHSCNATHYKCDQSPTHTFPTFSCGRRTCKQQVSDPNEHRRTCMHGHQYWSCNPSAVEWHKTRNPCTKLKVRSRWNSKRHRWEGVWEVCNESWARCDRGGRSCMDMYRRIRYHRE